MDSAKGVQARPRVQSALWMRLAFVPPVAFILSTIPGVRPEQGYDLLLDGLLNNLAYAMAPVICLLRMRRAGSRSLSGYVLALGLALYGLGNVFWTVIVRPMDPEPFPSGADALWLSFYLCAFVVLLLILRRRDESFPVSLWLDGLVGGSAIGALVAAAVIGPIVQQSSGSWAAVATTTAYPLLDLLLLLVMASALSLFRWRPPAGMWFLTAGLVLFVLADVTYLFQTARETYASGGPVDGVWVFAVVLIAMTPAWPDKPTGVRVPSWALVSIPLVAATSAVGLLLLDHTHPLHPVALGLAAGTIGLALLRLVATFREVTSLAHNKTLAFTDELTGLANRRALYDHAARRLAAVPPSTRVALLLLDLDRFKEVNDSLGHHAGDTLLCHVAGQLREALSDSTDLVVRLGGDEFAFLMIDVDEAEAERVAKRIREVLEVPVLIEHVTVRVGGSVGIAMLPAGVADLAALLRQADVAMYHAKSGRLGTSTYRAEDDEFATRDRLETIELLRRDIEFGLLVVHYQPKVDARARTIEGVEALVRWHHPTRGLLYPDAFLPMVEDCGLMGPLTNAVLEQVLDQSAIWRNHGRVLPVAVNLSASSLIDLDLPDRVGQMLAERDLPASALQIEITEDFLMADRARAREILGQLRAQGIRVSVDDYGTGYSSLAYLKELPIDELKLDRSFVTGMAGDHRALAIVRSTIGLAHSLGLRLVAEGVEDAQTARELALAGCDMEQGFFYARPLPPAELELWLDTADVFGSGTTDPPQPPDRDLADLADLAETVG